MRRPVDRGEENLMGRVKVAYASNTMNSFTSSMDRLMLGYLQEERSELREML